MVEHFGSIQIVINYLNVPYVNVRLILGQYTEGLKSVFEQPGRAEKPNITEAAKNELKPGEGR